MNEKQIIGTISGSIRKFWDEICKYALEFEKLGVKIISPEISEVEDSNKEFIYLKNDKAKTIEGIEKKHLFCIARSDFLFVVNPKGYIGISTALEIGYALSRGILVYTLEEPTDIVIKKLSILNPKPSAIIKDTIKNKSIKSSLDENLSNLQEYFARKVIERGFENETEKDLLILLIEELGELSHIIRTFSGLKIKKSTLEKKDHLNLEGEIADILIYIIILANKLGIDLFESLKIKENENEKREWVVFDPQNST